jgi:hypothetical protein
LGLLNVRLLGDGANAAELSGKLGDFCTFLLAAKTAPAGKHWVGETMAAEAEGKKLFG